MKSPFCFLLVISFMLWGCAAYELEPLSTNHPANPNSLASTKSAASKTLAYTQADIPSPAPIMKNAAAQHGGHEGHQQPQGGAPKTATGEGKVVATVPNASQVVVEHEEIKGFMDAMTMGYRVEPASLLEGLKPGDQVRFTIDVEKKTIVKIEKK